MYFDLCRIFLNNDFLFLEKMLSCVRSKVAKCEFRTIMPSCDSRFALVGCRCRVLVSGPTSSTHLYDVNTLRALLNSLNTKFAATPRLPRTTVGTFRALSVSLSDFIKPRD